MVQVQRVWEQNFRVYGARKVWKQMNRESIHVARCTVERLMADLGIEGARRGKRVRTTVPDRTTVCPQDLVQRQFEVDRPNRLLSTTCSNPLRNLFYFNQTASAIPGVIQSRQMAALSLDVVGHDFHRHVDGRSETFLRMNSRERVRVGFDNFE